MRQKFTSEYKKQVLLKIKDRVKTKGATIVAACEHFGVTTSNYNNWTRTPTYSQYRTTVNGPTTETTIVPDLMIDKPVFMFFGTVGALNAIVKSFDQSTTTIHTN